MKVPQFVSLITLSGPGGILAGSALLLLALSVGFVAVYATVWGARQPPVIREYLLDLVRALRGRK